MNTDTPETDAVAAYEGNWDTKALRMTAHARRMERECDEWKAKYIQQNKDLGCEMMDPNGTIWDHAQTLQRERDEARGQLVGIENKMRVELGGHPDSELWGEAGLIAATMRCVDALGEVTDQRDEARGQRGRLAGALRECREDSVELLAERDWWKNETRIGYQERYCVTRDNIDRADEALQSLNPNAEVRHGAKDADLD